MEEAQGTAVHGCGHRAGTGTLAQGRRRGVEYSIAHSIHAAASLSDAGASTGRKLDDEAWAIFFQSFLEAREAHRIERAGVGEDQAPDVLRMALYQRLRTTHASLFQD